MECEIYVGLCCNKEKETRKSSAHQHSVAGCRQKLVSREYKSYQENETYWHRQCLT